MDPNATISLLIECLDTYVDTDFDSTDVDETVENLCDWLDRLE